MDLNTDWLKAVLFLKKLLGAEMVGFVPRKKEVGLSFTVFASLLS